MKQATGGLRGSATRGKGAGRQGVYRGRFSPTLWFVTCTTLSGCGGKHQVKTDSKDAGKATLDFEAMRSAFLDGEEAIDINGDGQPEWHLVYGDRPGLPTSETIDRDRNGSPEIRVERSGDETSITLDHDGDGRSDEKRSVRANGGTLQELIVARDTDEDGVLDERMVSSFRGGSAFEVTVYRDTSQGSEVISSVDTELSFEQPADTVSRSLGCASPEEIEAARREAASTGWECLSLMGQRVEADLMAAFLLEATIYCLDPSDRRYHRDWCAHVWPSSDWGSIYLSNYGACRLARTLFHEALHHTFVQGHLPGQVATDRVYACARSCFDDPQDQCLRRACLAQPCDHGQCWAQECDPDTGDCGAGKQGFDGSSCDDGDACTEDDACAGETCTGEPLCDDDNSCTQDLCSGGKCSYPPLDCDDGESCTNDWCRAGDCQHDDAEDATACGLGGVCKQGVCRSAACEGQPDGKECGLNVSGQPCEEEITRCTAQQCVAVSKPDGTACGFGRVCHQGVCEGSPCEGRPDGEGCGLSVSGQPCEEEIMQCAAQRCVVLSKSDGTACGVGGVCHTGACTGPCESRPCGACEECVLDEADPINFVCLPRSTCSEECGVNGKADGTSCDDGDGCTSGDKCMSGHCVGTRVSCCGEPCCAGAPLSAGNRCCADGTQGPSCCGATALAKGRTCCGDPNARSSWPLVACSAEQTCLVCQPQDPINFCVSAGDKCCFFTHIPASADCCGLDAVRGAVLWCPEGWRCGPNSACLR